MKRLLLCGAAVVAAGLLLAPVALASTRASHRGSERVRHVPAAASPYARLGADPTYAISGHVRDFNGDPVLGAEVDWGWWDNGYWFGGSNYPGDTGADGKFNFAALAGNPGSDDLSVYYPLGTGVGTWSMESWALDFTANNDTTLFSYEMQPAQVNLTVAHAPSTKIDVLAGNESVGFAQSVVQLDAGGSGTASVLPMSNFDDVLESAYTPLPPSNPKVVYVVCRSQAESLAASPVSLAAGATAPDTVDLDWSAAQHSVMAGPLCRHSGKPGTKATMVLSGWPVNEIAGFWGYDGVHSGVFKGSWTSLGADQTKTLSLTIPKTAPVGLYEIDTYRTDAPDSLVDMWDYYQVCTFKASASSILHGHAVRLSGKVPGTGSVTIYSTWHKVSAAPGTLAASGWHKVGVYKTSSGRFTSSLLHPTRTMCYVAKYKGLAFQAFTSVVRVGVR